MMRLTVFFLFGLMILCPNLSSAHEDDQSLPVDSDTIVVPRNIPLLDFVRYRRVDHRLVLDRIETRGDVHHVGTLSQNMSRLALMAGRENPRATSSLLWKIAQMNGSAERTAALKMEVAHLSKMLPDLEAKLSATDPEATDALQALQNDLDTVRSLLALVTAWGANPMDGAGS